MKMHPAITAVMILKQSLLKSQQNKAGGFHMIATLKKIDASDHNEHIS
jgi:hypothetical protein